MGEERRFERSISRGGDGEERRERGLRDGEPDRFERKMKPTAYVGVVTSAVPPALSAQLGLGEGFGLVVDEVVPESPAKAAGIERYDVLKQLNEQQLVDPAQLATLVRGHGKDKEVAVTIIRKGQEQKLNLKIGEKMLPEREPSDRRSGLEILRRRVDEGGRPPEPRGPDRQGGRGGDGPSGVGVRPADLLRDIRPGAPGMSRGERTDGRSRWDASHASVKMRDNDGEVEILVRDGRRTLNVRSSSGDTVFTGPVDTEEQRKALPEEYRKKLAQLEFPDAVPAPPREHRRVERLLPPTSADRHAEVQ
jgi:serine protease Do